MGWGPLFNVVQIVPVVSAAPALAWMLAGALFGLHTRAVRIGFGPTTGAVSLFGLRLELALLPVGSSVEYATAGSDGLYQLDRLRRFFLYVSGPLFGFAIAWVVLGSEAGPSFLRAFGQIGRGTIDMATATELWRRLLTLDLWTCTGQLAAKNAAFNLLPIPPLGGGVAVVELLSPTRSEGTPAWRQWLTNLSAWVLLLVYARWLWAFVLAFLSLYR